ncbi:hypothetical protein BC826DRAFT_523526 [Russula brevipes]|nr:hypothetical protein BC826DRAFT_523526 [Russula brevipes]
MFLFPSLIATTVAATRMHRSLTDFVSRLPECTSDGLRGGSCPTSRSTQAPVLHVSHKRQMTRACVRRGLSV